MSDINKLCIPKEEVLRYLGYKAQNIDSTLDKIIDETIKESKSLILPRYVYAKYDKKSKEENLILEGTSLLLVGNDIKEHLKDSEEVILLAATIGNKIEKKISLYQRTNLTKALILDSCATTAVEELCDLIENKIKEEVHSENKGITFRYSPGYGDLPLSLQKPIIDTLKADKIIGLTTSDKHLLFPRKSVTAIIGIIEREQETNSKGCEVCKNYENCSFRKEGIRCGN